MTWRDTVVKKESWEHLLRRVKMLLDDRRVKGAEAYTFDGVHRFWGDPLNHVEEELLDALFYVHAAHDRHYAYRNLFEVVELLRQKIDPGNPQWEQYDELVRRMED